MARLLESQASGASSSYLSSSEPNRLRVDVDSPFVEVPASTTPCSRLNLGVVRPPLPEPIGRRRKSANDA